jgi:hypothetical protein
MATHYPFPAKGGIEPSLAELLNDPTLKCLLRRDGLSTDDVMEVIADWRKQRGQHALKLPVAA